MRFSLSLKSIYFLLLLLSFAGTVWAQEYKGDKIIPGTTKIEEFIQNSFAQVPFLRVGGIQSNLYHAITIENYGVEHSIGGFISIDYFDITMPDGVVLRYTFNPSEKKYLPNSDLWKNGGYGSSLSPLLIYLNSTLSNSITPSITLKNDRYQIYLNSNPFEGKIIQNERYGLIQPRSLDQYGAEINGSERFWLVNGSDVDVSDEVIANVMRARPTVTLSPQSLEITGWVRQVELIREDYSILRGQNQSTPNTNSSNQEISNNESVEDYNQDYKNSNSQSTERDVFGNPVKSTSNTGITNRTSQTSAMEDYNAQRKKEIDDYNANILSEAQNIANQDIEGEIKQAMSKIDNGTYSSPEAMMKTGMSIMNMASNAGQVYTGAALTGVGIVSGILEGAAKAKAAKEANEERARQRELAEAREKEIRQAVKNARLSLFSHFKNGELPVSSTSSLTQNLYYFVYAYQSNEMFQDRPSVVLSNVFAIGKYPDGTWPMKTKVAEEIMSVSPLNEILAGPYQTLYEANLKYKMFSDNMNRVSLNAKSIKIEGFNPHDEDELISASTPTVDFWGNPIGNTVTPKEIIKPKSTEKVELDYWGNPIKKKGNNR